MLVNTQNQLFVFSVDTQIRIVSYQKDSGLVNFAFNFQNDNSKVIKDTKLDGDYIYFLTDKLLIKFGTNGTLEWKISHDSYISFNLLVTALYFFVLVLLSIL
jgi:type I site-specific restriction-modification system R (restriction) subunit